MSQRLCILLFLVIAGIHMPVHAQYLAPSTQWTRASAFATIESVDIDAELELLEVQRELEDAGRTIEKLTWLESREDWPLPAREAAILRFTQSLADLPADAVAPGIMDHLNNYVARTMVAHEDHAGGMVPLFNIRAAASGVENTWQRREFSYRAQRLLAEDPAALIESYLADKPNNIRRQALTVVLEGAPLREVEVVQDILLAQLPDAPELTPVAATTARLTTDPFAIQSLLIYGKGTGIAVSLKEIGHQLPANELRELLLFAMQNAPADNAGLAIAAWAPRLRHDMAVRDLLVENLSNDTLGASAALALSAQLDVQTIHILQDLVAHDSSAGRRAQMALDLGLSASGELP